MKLAAAVLLVALVAPAAGEPAGPSLRVGFLQPDGRYLVATLPLETYVARVLAGEAARNSRPAALEALAITIRTFALANRGRHRADGFDLCDQTHCQVLRAATPATEHAAAATADRILLYRNRPASVYYTASCGGRTEIPSAVWPGADDPPFLPSQPDDACGGAPAWTADVAAADLLRAFRAAGFRGARLRGLRIASRDRSGRVARIRIAGLTPDSISGQDLRVVVGRTLGWQLIKSAAFDLSERGGRYRFAGHGSGHGVGLCVIGSAHLAAEGESAAQILSRYFPGLDIASAAAAGPTSARAASPIAAAGGPELLVSLPDEDAGERAQIAARAAAARDALARELGVAIPPRLTLRFHATADEYQRATGQPPFTSGALVDGELHLLPLAVLRDRGVLDRTIRRELVHLLTDGALADRPLWVRQGAAVYFSDLDPAAKPADTPASGRRWPDTPRPPASSCPEDSELAHPVSVGALTNAYARARACFARQIASGRSWRDVR